MTMKKIKKSAPGITIEQLKENSALNVELGISAIQADNLLHARAGKAKAYQAALDVVAYIVTITPTISGKPIKLAKAWQMFASLSGIKMNDDESAASLTRAQTAVRVAKLRSQNKAANATADDKPKSTSTTPVKVTSTENSTATAKTEVEETYNQQGARLRAIAGLVTYYNSKPTLDATELKAIAGLVNVIREVTAIKNNKHVKTA